MYSPNFTCDHMDQFAKADSLAWDMIFAIRAFEGTPNGEVLYPADCVRLVESICERDERDPDEYINTVGSRKIADWVDGDSGFRTFRLAVETVEAMTSLRFAMREDNVPACIVIRARLVNLLSWFI